MGPPDRGQQVLPETELPEVRVLLALGLESSVTETLQWVCHPDCSEGAETQGVVLRGIHAAHLVQK